MNKILRNAVLLFLKQLPKDKYERFNKAFEYYKQAPDKVTSVETKLNRVGFSEEGLQHLLYDLQKLFGITDAEIASQNNVPVIGEIIPETTVEELAEQLESASVEFIELMKLEDPDPTTVNETLGRISDLLSELAQKQIAVLTVALGKAEKELKVLGTQKPKDLKAINATEKTIDKIQNDIKEIGEAAKEKLSLLALEKREIPVIPLNSDNSDFQNELKGIAEKVFEHTDIPESGTIENKFVSAEELMPIRDEFPFLNNDDCPEIMFVVVGKRISAYRRYQKLYEQLQFALDNEGSLTPEAQAQLASDTQEANAENLALWDELKYYNENKEILGKHPLFRESVAKKEVDAMTTDQLAKYRTSSATFISKKKTALKDKKLTPEKVAELEAAIQDREYRLGLVNTKLGVNVGK